MFENVEPKESSSQIMNLDDYAEEDLGVDDDGEADLDEDFGEFKNSEIVRTRTYDISILYDKYYQVPFPIALLQSCISCSNYNLCVPITSLILSTISR